MHHTEEPGQWTRGDTIVTIDSPWVRLLCERWRDDAGAALDYWRVERAHSVVIMPIWRGRLLLPQRQFRPGVQRPTLDLAGGRIPPGSTARDAAPALLHKELGVLPEMITAIEAIDERGWVINSSFSNQLLFGVVATLDDRAALDERRVHAAVPCSVGAVAELARELECLQCRAVVQAWLLRQIAASP